CNREADCAKETSMAARPLLVGMAGLFVAGGVAANDTALTYGGSPRPLNGKTTVAMRSEFVRLEVGEKLVAVDCRFTFENRGSAHKVRVGFPDEGGEPGVTTDSRTGKPVPAEP